MNSTGEIFVAWPEDYALHGEELEALKTQLAPRASNLNRLLGRSTIAGPVLEVVAEGEAAVREALGALGRPVSNRNLREIISSCLNRCDEESGADVTPDIKLEREDVLALASVRLISRGEIQLLENRFLQLATPA